MFVCRAILLGFVCQLGGTLALAAEQSLSPKGAVVQKADSLEFIDARQSGLDTFIQEMNFLNAVLSPCAALLRCYEHVAANNVQLSVDDVLEAIPELM